MRTTVDGLGPIRTATLLAAIGAQETLEYEHNTRAEGTKHLGHSASAAPMWAKFDRAVMAAATRRNAAERRLTAIEHRVWELFRKSDTAGREAIRAVLTDPPGKTIALPELTRRSP